MANLTSKELSALEDQISFEQTLVKKYQAMAYLCNDAQIQQGFNNIAQKPSAALQCAGDIFTVGGKNMTNPSQGYPAAG